MHSAACHLPSASFAPAALRDCHFYFTSKAWFMLRLSLAHGPSPCWWGRKRDSPPLLWNPTAQACLTAPPVWAPYPFLSLPSPEQSPALPSQWGTAEGRLLCFSWLVVNGAFEKVAWSG